MAGQDKPLDITREELERIENAMKNEEFRKMFAEYAKEISDPGNRKRYEEEIALLEAERGMDVKFVNPQDGFVIKTSIKSDAGKKAFINICQNDAIGKASYNVVKKKVDMKSVSGQEWSIPYSLNHPKDDTDKAGKRCVVYDVVLNTRTYQMGQENPRFKELIVTTSLDAIEKKWNVKLDRKNLKYPKLKFKGVKQATIIRTSNNTGAKEPGADIQIGDTKLPYPYKDNVSSSDKPTTTKSPLGTGECSQPGTSEPADRQKVTPEFSIVHRGMVDLQNFTNARDSQVSTRPQELVVNVDLPLCKSSAGVDLDIFEKQLILDSVDPLYHLEVTLPYPVKEDEGSAKFDKSKRRLMVVLPVVPSPRNDLVAPSIKAVHGEVDLKVTVDETSNLTSQEMKVLSDNEGCPGESGAQSGLKSDNTNRQIKSNDICSDTIDLKNGDDDVTNQDGLDEVASKKTGYKDDHMTTTDDANGLTTEDVNERETGTKGMSGWSTPAHSGVHFNTEKSAGMACPFFKTPDYSFHQDSTSVTFVLHVSHVSIETTSVGFNDNKCYINFPSTPSSPSNPTFLGYALFVQFPAHCLIDSDKCRIDSNENNLVLVLYKQESSVGLWDWCMVGSDEAHLERKLFLTQATLQQSLEKCEDLWAEPSLVTSHEVKSISEDATKIRLNVRANSSTDSTKMGNILARAEELLTGEVKEIKANDPASFVEEVPREDDVLSPTGDVCINEVKVPLVIEEKCDKDCNAKCNIEGTLKDGELQEVEVVEETFEDEEGEEETQHGLSTVQEVDSPDKVLDSSKNAELQKARVIKCRKNRRRRRRSTGSHESSSISEEEGELGTGHGKYRGKHARRLRKSRSLSLGSSAESHDDAEHETECNGHRSVRFNLVPEVHVFSKKSEKKRWKELRRQQLINGNEEFGAHGDHPQCTLKSLLKDNGVNHGHERVEDRNVPNGSSDDGGGYPGSELNDLSSEVMSDGGGNSVYSGTSDTIDKPQLTNSLIFDLDD